MNAAPVTLAGQWRHSFEEDSPGVRVYRRATVELPPARGRAALELSPDGSFVESAIGRGDAPARATGAWSMAPDGSISLTYSDSARAARRLEIVAHDADTLKVRAS